MMARIMVPKKVPSSVPSPPNKLVPPEHHSRDDIQLKANSGITGTGGQARAGDHPRNSGEQPGEKIDANFYPVEY